MRRTLASVFLLIAALTTAAAGCVGSRRVVCTMATPATVTRNAVHLFEPGNVSGNGLNLSSGSLVAANQTFTNDSGKPLAAISLVFSGWYLTSSGTANIPNNYTVNCSIVYNSQTTPITSGGNANITVIGGSDITTDVIRLPAAIPAGASFTVNVSATVPNGQYYNVNLGLSGVLTTTAPSGLVKEMIYAVGDSIMALNNNAVYTACTGRCPVVASAISGTTAQSYGASSAANFTKQVNLAKRLGATRFISDFGTNDLNAGTSATTLEGYISNMAALAHAQGIKFTQTTMTPKVTNLPNQTASLVTSVGTTMSMVVPNAALFVVGEGYVISGASPASYNLTAIAQSVNTGTNIVTFLFPGGTSPATGTITVGPWKGVSSREFQTQYSSAYAPGPSSYRGLFNAWVRAGNVDGYVEWANAVEISQDDGKWQVGGEGPYVLAAQLATISTTNNAVGAFVTSYSYGPNTTEGGFEQFTTGVNAGYQEGAIDNSAGGALTTGPFPFVPSQFDSLYVMPGSDCPSVDGLHPNTSGGYTGGWVEILQATTVWLNGVL
jgi:hypothetical protein